MEGVALRVRIHPVNLSRVKNDAVSAEDFAGSDVWSALSTYEVVPTRFVQWLDGLDEPSAHEPIKANPSIN